MRWILRFGVLAGALLVMHRVGLRQAELAAITGEFGDRQHALQRAEADLDALGREADQAAVRVQNLDREVTVIEVAHPGGIPRSEFGAYRRLVKERNRVAEEHTALLARLRALEDGYRRGVDAHNAGVEEANALARKTTPWAVARDVWSDFIAAWVNRRSPAAAGP